jgi:hypothetical protein
MINKILNIFKFGDISKNHSKLAGYVESCGVNSLYVGEFLAQGMQHYVFAYGKEFVIKIPKFDLFNSLYGILKPNEVDSDWKIIRQFFEEYVVDTKVFNSPDKKRYVVIQKRVHNFENVNSSNIQSVLKDFQALHNRNYILETKLGYSLDLWGKSGILKSIRKSFGRINVFVELSNIVIDKSNPKKLKLKIIDTNLYRIRGNNIGISRILTDKIIYLFSDYFLKKGRFLS